MSVITALILLPFRVLQAISFIGSLFFGAIILIAVLTVVGLATGIVSINLVSTSGG